MGKNKKGRPHLHKQATRAKDAVKRRQHSQSTNNNQATKLHGNPSRVGPRVPFRRSDSVLLVGEGDFSFALSLLKHYKPAVIVATSFDSLDTVLEKHPASEQTISRLDANVINKEVFKGTSVAIDSIADKDDEPWNGFSDPSESGDDEVGASPSSNEAESTVTCKVLFGIDATKLSSRHKKILRPYSPFDKICFNFPHVGGLSTDVNRQVRANQQLLVEFFNSAKPLMSGRSPRASIHRSQDGRDGESDLQPSLASSIIPGNILVTLFEGEPYSLWNVRDLARHCGLQVVESFRFPWSAYPGYQHARTLGDIKVGKDRTAEGKRRGAWRGEEREARCYLFAVREGDGSNAGNDRKPRKRRRSMNSSSSEESS